MNFRPAPPRDDPEMNLIPLIDVLLVILIFLAASTSFTQMRQLQIALPEASAQALEDDQPISLAISQEGLYALNGEYVGADDDDVLAQALRKAAQGRDTPTLRINAGNSGKGKTGRDKKAAGSLKIISLPGTTG